MTNRRRNGRVWGLAVAAALLLAACGGPEKILPTPVDRTAVPEHTAAPAAPTAAPAEEAAFTGIQPSAWVGDGAGGVMRLRFDRGEASLILEFLADDRLHFEMGKIPAGRSLDEPIFTTPSVLQTQGAGLSAWQLAPDGRMVSGGLAAAVDAELCIHLEDTRLSAGGALGVICPENLTQRRKRLRLDFPEVRGVYGLGQQFPQPGVSNGDWLGRVRFSSSGYGNVMEGYNGGAVGNTQIPVATFLRAGGQAFGLYMDSAAPQRWDFRESPYVFTTSGDWMRGYVLLGEGPAGVRAQYLELTGRPPVPPRKMFGMWVSEYGFDNWAEMDDKLSSLRAANFPVDGVVLDLQWFGGIQPDENSRMGSLRWDTQNFPNPAGKIQALRADGIGVMTIEEPYISRGLPEHADLAARGYLVRQGEGGEPVFLQDNPWWGKGGMLDWTQPEAGAYWHDIRRQPLVDLGVMAHWTDLGEPEQFSAAARYAGLPGDYGPLTTHADVSNLYNFFWSQSLFEGYARNGVEQRLFILSRSGTAGSQRFGVAMWSGDIGSNRTSLAAHFNAQMHMSFSGMDYYGTDIGGFHRGGLEGNTMLKANLDEMYTQWFAYGALFDVPVRPHTENLCNCKETAPDRIGDAQANLDALRLRYALIPTLYSLAHRAYLAGEAVYPPLALAIPQDDAVLTIGDQKMIGPGLMAAVGARLNLQKRDVYLPAGTWFDFYTQEEIVSQGQVLKDVPMYAQGVYRVPLYARAGAVVPMMFVDEQTLDAFGRRKDGSVRDELIVRAYAGEGSFELFEDDGQTTAYQRGEVRRTLLSQGWTEDGGLRVVIGAAIGAYAGMTAQRQNVVEVVTGGKGAPREVLMNGAALPRQTAQVWEQSEVGWSWDGTFVRVRTGVRDTTAETALTLVW
ncbi:glycoside hydrolase family 31 protein [Levilinea saccharolytica]|uniref:glycoside hydrolase family 31 protein n=2 Tax=Levilinea saccharolytica TaxID=229921 RepID=UPI000B129CBC|nr:TIM-barrel domain-containing protein [Levilinea saccharolytica]